jgi:hypothetical protein
VKLTTHLHLSAQLKKEYSYTSTPRENAILHRDKFNCTALYTVMLIKVKVKVTLEQATKAQRGRSMTRLFL